MEQNIDYIHELKKLGEYLNSGEAIIKKALEKQREISDVCFNKPIGDILVINNSIPKEKLIEALQLQRIDRLKNCPVFFGLSMYELTKVSRFIYEITLDAGLEFIHQNTQSNCLFLIVRGKALIYRKDEDGQDVELCTLGPGECVGEMGYLSGDRRSATVKTIEDTVLLQVHYADLESLFDITPILAKNFLNIVANRLRKGNLRFQDTLKKKRDAEYSLKSLFSLLDMSNIFELELDEEGLIERVVCTASKVLKAERASLFIVNKLTGELWSKVAEGENVQVITVPAGKGVAGWVAQNNEIVNISDAYSDYRFNTDIDFNTGYRTESILCAPVRNLHGEVIGVIQLINKRGGVFDKDDEAILQAFSYQTAIAVENFLLYQKKLDNHKKISILLDISNSINQTLELEELIKKIVAKTSDVLNAERSSLFLLDSEKGKLYSKVAQGLGNGEINFSASDGIAGYVVNTGKIVNIKNAYEDERFNTSFDKDTGFRTNTILCAPLHNRAGKIFGVTQAINKRGGVFEIEDEELLKAVTAQIAIALENAQLYERTLSMKNHLNSINNSISSCIITLDNGYRIVTVNNAGLKLFGLEQHSLLKNDIRSLFGNENGMIVKYIDQLYEKGKCVIDYDVKLIIDNSKHSMNINFVPLVDHNNLQKGVVLVFEDITTEKRMKSTLVRYMTKDLVEKVLNDPAKQMLGGEVGRATVFCADIRSFTGLAERLTPFETVEFLNDYFTRMVDIIFEESGILDKYMGDALMAVFGIPYKREDDSVRAVRSALRMTDQLLDLNKTRVDKGLGTFSMGIGINSGDILSGNIGSEKRMDFTVIGDDVNIAFRLEGLNKLYGTKILISESTCKEIGDEFTVREIDRVCVKGKKKFVKVFEVLGKKNYKMSLYEECFIKGLGAYYKQDFKEAALMFKKGEGEDNPCKLFLSRCENFIENPPEKGWEGIWVCDSE